MTSAPDTREAAAGHLTYRRDIDGLRAVAVLPVVLYHFGLPGTGGGFVGVDVFFVISGFLITSILLADIEGARFSILKFYERRVRRILPALFAMLTVVGLVGLTLLPPRGLEELGKSSIAAIAFVSNAYFWRSTSGYFDGPAETRPLLHTWSLGVEEQFYILFPIVLAVLMRFGRRPAAIMLVLALVIGFIASSILTPLSPRASFFLAPTRAWQLLIGAVLAIIPLAPRGRWAGETAALIGLALIIASVRAYSADTLTPGFWALAPCLGATLLIYSGGGAQLPMINRILATRPLVAIGLISYSLYLWHWPVYVFLRHYILFEPLNLVWASVGVAASFVLAALSWRFVEQPIRKRQLFDGRGALFAWAGGIAAALCLIFGLVVVANGLPGRYPNLEATRMQVEAPRPDWAPYSHEACFSATAWSGDVCWLSRGQPGGTRVLLWGDSYAGNYASGFLLRRGEMAAAVLEYTAPRCPPVLSYDAQANRDCAPFNRQALEVISENRIDTVILAAKWESYGKAGRFSPEDLGRTVAALRERGLRVVVIGQSPIYAFDFPDEYHLARTRRGASGPDSLAPLTFDPVLNEQLRAATPGAAFFDPLKSLCEGSRCYYRINGLYTVGDSGHLTRAGSERLVGELLKMPELGGRE